MLAIAITGAAVCVIAVFAPVIVSKAALAKTCGYSGPAAHGKAVVSARRRLLAECTHTATDSTRPNPVIQGIEMIIRKRTFMPLVLEGLRYLRIARKLRDSIVSHRLIGSNICAGL
jgi:hypothetical protein